MKRSNGIIAIIVLIAVAGAYFYWQTHKNAIIKSGIKTAISKKTDSLYYIKYDSSAIDEVNGNASFFNVVLQPDSLAQKISETDTTTPIVYRVRIGEVAVKGADVAGLLLGSNLKATSIAIISPDIVLIKTGKKEQNKLTRNDSIALYEKILGKFKSIKAGEVVIQNGRLRLLNRNEQAYTTLTGINVNLKDFKIDSTKDYENLVSYFVKGIVAKVENIVVSGQGKGTLTFNKVLYDAGNRLIRVGNLNQRNNSGKVVSEINNILIDKLQTNSFIYDQQLIAHELSTSGGSISLYKSKGTHKQNIIELDSSFFDKAVLEKISIGGTKVLLYDKSLPAKAPMVLNNIRFNASSIPAVTSGNSYKNIIANSKWILSGDGLVLESLDKIYKISIGAFEIDNNRSLAKTNKIWITPQVTEEAYTGKLKTQHDLYDIQFNNIIASGFDLKTAITQNIIQADRVDVEPVIKIFNDRTIPPDTKSKVGRYPQQALVAMETPINIRKVNVKNGYVSYRERGALSGQIGNMFFNKLNAVITNVTNMPSVYNKDPELTLHATTKLLGVSTLQTTWHVPLNSKDGSFALDGHGYAIDGKVLNAVTEPLGMTTVRSGNLNNLTFNISGTDLNAHVVSEILYKDLKLEILKKKAGENDLGKKKALSFLANIIIRNENPQHGVVRKNEIDFKRDISKSFFNLVWKSMFASVKKTIIGQNNAK